MLGSLLRVCKFQCWSVAATCLLAGNVSNAKAQIGFRDYTSNYGRISDDIDTEQNPSTQPQIFTDFDDLHAFNPFVDDLSADADQGSGAIDALNVVWLDDRSPDEQADSPPYFLPQAASALRMRNLQKTGFSGGSLRPSPNDESFDEPFDPRFATIAITATTENTVENRVGVIYGLGAFTTDLQSQTTASGSILGTTYWAAGIHNQIIGPKGGVVWQRIVGKWTLDFQGLLMFGANATDVSNTAQVGEPLIPGALNRPLYYRPTRVDRDNSSLSLAPGGELRAQSCWRLSKSTSLHLNWSSVAVSNLLATGDKPTYTTITDTHYQVTKEDLLVHHVFCGVQYVR